MIATISFVLIILPAFALSAWLCTCVLMLLLGREDVDKEVLAYGTLVALALFVGLML